MAPYVGLEQWWHHLYPRYSPGVSVAGRGGSGGGGICLKEMGKVGHRALSSERFKQGISVDVMSILEGCFPIVG